MLLHKDIGTLALSLIAYGPPGAPIDDLESSCAIGGVERGAHFRECLTELKGLGFVDVMNGQARLAFTPIQRIAL